MWFLIYSGVFWLDLMCSHGFPWISNFFPVLTWPHLSFSYSFLFFSFVFLRNSNFFPFLGKSYGAILLFLSPLGQKNKTLPIFFDDFGVQSHTLCSFSHTNDSVSKLCYYWGPNKNTYSTINNEAGSIHPMIHQCTLNTTTLDIRLENS